MVSGYLIGFGRLPGWCTASMTVCLTHEHGPIAPSTYEAMILLACAFTGETAMVEFKIIPRIQY